MKMPLLFLLEDKDIFYNCVSLISYWHAFEHRMIQKKYLQIHATSLILSKVYFKGIPDKDIDILESPLFHEMQLLVSLEGNIAQITL